MTARQSKRRGKSETALLKRLAGGFSATNWGLSKSGLQPPDDVHSLLDISPEQVVLLCATGFLKGSPSSGDEVGIELAEVIRFMEEHGDWWFRLRGRAQLERLKRIAEPKRDALLRLLKAEVTA